MSLFSTPDPETHSHPSPSRVVDRGRDTGGWSHVSSTEKAALTHYPFVCPLGYTQGTLPSKSSLNSLKTFLETLTTCHHKKIKNKIELLFQNYHRRLKSTRFRHGEVRLRQTEIPRRLFFRLPHTGSRGLHRRDTERTRTKDKGTQKVKERVKESRQQHERP